MLMFLPHAKEQGDKTDLLKEMDMFISLFVVMK